MIVNRAYKTELKPNNRQRTCCLRSAGCARFAYNWGLRQKIDEYKATGKSPSAIELHRRLNALKKTDYPWMYDSSKAAPQEALRNLDIAFQNFFRRCKTGEKPGFPRFKSRHRGIGSFSLTGSIHVESDRVKIPRIGWIRLKEHGYIPTDVKIISTTVSEKAGRWFVSISVEQEIEQPARKPDSVGVDVGVSTLATLSDGSKFENPKPLNQAQKRLRLLQKSVSRKVKGSSNRRKAVRLVQRQHYRISCIRKDASHKSTTAITKSYGLEVTSPFQ
jgi:putative transposase